MKVMLLPSAVAARPEQQYLTTYRINDSVAIDAGSLGLYGSPAEQARIKHVLLSHSHIDHVGSLPIFLENAYEGGRDCVTVYGSAEVLESLRRDIFNDRVWPDFVRLSPPSAPFLKLELLEAGKPIEVDGLKITPVPVNHVVPTMGFIVAEPGAAVAIPSDTGPTDAFWDAANATPTLRAVFLEVTFPNTMADLAAASKHLTPALFGREISKLRRPTTVYAVHIKARFLQQILTELQALQLPQLVIGEAGREYVV